MRGERSCAWSCYEKDFPVAISGETSWGRVVREARDVSWAMLWATLDQFRVAVEILGEIALSFAPESDTGDIQIAAPYIHTDSPHDWPNRETPSSPLKAMIGMAELTGGQRLPFPVIFAVRRRQDDRLGMGKLNDDPLKC